MVIAPRTSKPSVSRFEAKASIDKARCQKPLAVLSADRIRLSEKFCALSSVSPAAGAVAERTRRSASIMAFWRLGRVSARFTSSAKPRMSANATTRGP
jgi:hypothetical protein